MYFHKNSYHENKEICNFSSDSSIYIYKYIYISISIYLKQCENSPTNTIISINFEDHDSDHRIRQIVYKKQCKTQKPTRGILKQAFDLLFQIFLRLCQLQSYWFELYLQIYAIDSSSSVTDIA